MERGPIKASSHPLHRGLMGPTKVYCFHFFTPIRSALSLSLSPLNPKIFWKRAFFFFFILLCAPAASYNERTPNQISNLTHKFFPIRLSLSNKWNSWIIYQKRFPLERWERKNCLQILFFVRIRSDSWLPDTCTSFPLSFIPIHCLLPVTVFSLLARLPPILRLTSLNSLNYRFTLFLLFCFFPFFFIFFILDEWFWFVT